MQSVLSVESDDCKASTSHKQTAKFKSLSDAVRHFIIHERKLYPKVTYEQVMNEIIPKIYVGNELLTIVEKDCYNWLRDNYKILTKKECD